MGAEPPSEAQAQSKSGGRFLGGKELTHDQTTYGKNRRWVIFSHARDVALSQAALIRESVGCFATKRNCNI